MRSVQVQPWRDTTADVNDKPYRAHLASNIPGSAYQLSVDPQVGSGSAHH